MNIVVLISGNGSNLQALIDASLAGLPFKIVAVISNSADAYGLERARKAQIPNVVIDHRLYHNRNAFDEALRITLQRYQPELVVLAGFMRILGATVVNAFPNKILNIHPALLPKYPGLNTHQRALENNDLEHGVSIHIVTIELDAGPIIAQQAFTISTEDTPESLQLKAHEIEHQLYPDTLAKIARGELLLP